MMRACACIHTIKFPRKNALPAISDSGSRRAALGIRRFGRFVAAPGLITQSEARTAPLPTSVGYRMSRCPGATIPAMRMVPAELSGAVSLAQLTDLALRLNARTRQAWLQARAEAATLASSVRTSAATHALLSHNLGGRSPAHRLTLAGADPLRAECNPELHLVRFRPTGG